MRTRLAKASCLVLLAALAWAPVSPAVAGEPIEFQDDEVVITVGEGVELMDLLKALSKATRAPILWHEGDKSLQHRRVSGAPEIRAPKAKVFDMVRALLTFYELTLVPVGPKGYEMWLVLDARQTTGILRLKPVYMEVDERNVADLASQDGLFVATVIPVENIENLRDARQALQRIVTANNVGSVTEIPDASAFLVADFAPNVAAIWRTVREMDARPSGRAMQTAFFDLQHARADNVARVLQELFGRRKPTPAPAQGQPALDASVPDLRFSSDPDSNQVVVIAPQHTIEAMQVVVTRLDRPRKAAEGK